MTRLGALATVLALLVGGIVNLAIWRRRGLRLPRYVHALGGLALVFAVSLCGLDWLRRSSVDLSQCLVVIALLPTLVYVTFGFFAWPVMKDREPPDETGGAA